MRHLTFLNNTESRLFFVIFVACLFLTTSLFWIILSFVVAIAVATLLRSGVVPFFNARLTITKNRALVITGCSSGIGYDASLYYALHGFTVFAGVRKDADVNKLKSAFAALNSPKGTLIPFLIDVVNTDTITAAAATVAQYLADNGVLLYALVNNAGYAEGGALETQPLARVRAQLETNVTGQLAVTQAFMPLLRCSAAATAAGTLADRKFAPRIVWLSSGVGEVALAASGIYSASKHAVQALAHVMDAELSMKWGIRSILVQPGVVKTDFHATIATTRAAATAESKPTTTPSSSSSSSSSASSSGDDAAAVHAYYTRCVDRVTNRPVNYSPTSVVIDAFNGALLDSEPLQQYKAGNDSQLGLFVNRLLPPAAFTKWIAAHYFLKD